MGDSADLFAQVTSFANLYRAARRAAKASPTSHDTLAFLFDLEPRLIELQRQLFDDSYRPGPYRTFEVQDPKPRTISAAPFVDRVVHHALSAVLEPIFERYYISDSYACRQGKGLHAAARRAQWFARRFGFFLKLDVRHYFETVDHFVLKQLLARKVHDERVNALLHTIIETGAPGSASGKGLPIGNLTSQHFANFCLTALDHFIKDHLGVKGYCRYMDDLLLFGADKTSLHRWHKAVDAYVRRFLRLRLKHHATILSPVTEGIPFLGFRIWPSLVRLDGRRARRFRRKVRALSKAVDRAEIFEEDAACSAASLIGWIQHANTYRFRCSFIRRLEAQAEREGTES